MGRSQKLHKPLSFEFDEVLTSIADNNKPVTTTAAARPFLKWVGGKRSVLDELSVRMPKEYDTYCEPFLGGGALYFHLQPERALLSDVNFRLIITFRVVRDSVDKLIEQLKLHVKKHGKSYFLLARQKLSTEKDSVKIAALFIYLNKTCYNGLYRVNKSDLFNVPMGSYTDPAILDEQNLRAASEVLKGADIYQRDFSQMSPQKNNFYYLDPPYHTLYSSYDGSGFGEAEHRMLAKYCNKINTAGGFFMLSNSDTDIVRSLYKGYSIDVVKAVRSVSCKGHKRGKEGELIIRNYQ